MKSCFHTNLTNRFEVSFHCDQWDFLIFIFPEEKNLSFRLWQNLRSLWRAEGVGGVGWLVGWEGSLPPSLQTISNPGKPQLSLSS